MNDDEATNLLHRLADRVEVGPVPLRDVLRAGRRARSRHRRTAVLGVAAAVVLVLLGGVGVRQALRPGRPAAPATVPSTSAPAAPPGTRWVGIGHAAIAVPEGWGTNQTRCGQPRANTVVIDQGPIPLCAVITPPAVSDLQLEASPDVPTNPSFADAVPIRIDGEPALKTPLRCTNQSSSHLCTQALWIKQERALFTATSPHVGTVRRLLSSVRVDDAYVAVPGTYAADLQRGARAFTHAAEALGLRVSRRVVPGGGLPAGFIVRVDPAVGTMLKPGDTVHVTVSNGQGAPSGSGTATSSPQPSG